jgi:hypothetical protein
MMAPCLVAPSSSLRSSSRRSGSSLALPSPVLAPFAWVSRTSSLRRPGSPLRGS